jgi:hypothetical protein
VSNRNLRQAIEAHRDTATQLTVTAGLRYPQRYADVYETGRDLIVLAAATLDNVDYVIGSLRHADNHRHADALSRAVADLREAIA